MKTGGRSTSENNNRFGTLSFVNTVFRLVVFSPSSMSFSMDIWWCVCVRARCEHMQRLVCLRPWMRMLRCRGIQKLQTITTTARKRLETLCKYSLRFSTDVFLVVVTFISCVLRMHPTINQHKCIIHTLATFVLLYVQKRNCERKTIIRTIERTYKQKKSAHWNGHCRRALILWNCNAFLINVSGFRIILKLR